MKALFLVLIGTLACSASNPLAPPFAASQAVQANTIVFTLDTSCTGSHSVTFYIANNPVGTETLSPGQPSQPYVGNGWVVVQATLSNYTNSFYTVPTTLWTHRDDVNITGNVSHTINCTELSVHS